MRRITHLVVHCTATSQGATVAAIQRHWREVLGWRNPGYHIIVMPDGTPIRLAPDTATANGVAGHNATSLHVSYIGGINAQGRPMDNRTMEQKATMADILRNWKRQHPHAIIQGHRDFPGVRKACPSFNAKEEYKNL